MMKPSAPNTKPKVVEIVAGADDRFSVPGQREPKITLKAGEDAILHVTAQFGGMKSHDGAIHGLVVRELRDQGWNFRLKEGQQDLHVTAPAKPGTYLIQCSVVCGPGHSDMKMTLVVEQ